MISRATQALCLNAVASRERDQSGLYERALGRGRRGQFWSAVLGRPRQLLSLAEVSKTAQFAARRSAGARTVALDRICGSEGRVADFDREFNPLQERTRERWLGIASALEQGRALPPVALIQVGDRYFVRDGHHRISVARALGCKTIEATLEVWQAA